MSTSTRKRKNRQRKNRPQHPATDLHNASKLPTREPAPDEFITSTQIRAHYAAALVGINTPIRAWTDTSPHTSRLRFPTGAFIDFDHRTTPSLVAYTPCPRGAHHRRTIATPRDLATAEHEARTCRDDHFDTPDDFQWPDMVHLPTTRVLALHDAHDNDETEEVEPADELALTPAADDTDPDRTHEIDVRALRADHDTEENPS